MVCEDHFKGARALAERRDLYVNPTSFGETSHVFSCNLSMAAWDFIDCREKALSKIATLPGSKPEEVLSMAGGIQQGCQTPWTGTSVAWCIETP